MNAYRCHTCETLLAGDLLPVGWWDLQMLQSGDVPPGSKRFYCSTVCIARWAVNLTDAHDGWRETLHKGLDAPAVEP